MDFIFGPHLPNLSSGFARQSCQGFTEVCELVVLEVSAHDPDNHECFWVQKLNLLIRKKVYRSTVVGSPEINHLKKNSNFGLPHVT
jgi:hypothetical protein